MDHRGKDLRFWFSAIICLTLAGCGIFSTSKPGIDQSPTTTPTSGGGVVLIDPTGHPCEGVSGTLEIQILVGPSEVVGLTPFSLGEIPFDVLDEDGAFPIEGGGQLESYSDVLSAAWGTYTVTFEGDLVASGECVSTGDVAVLDLNVEMTGEQNVEIVFDGAQMNYPWSGTSQIEATLPVEDGAQQEGEGWILILHLN